jgi:hypothetical protein
LVAGLRGTAPTVEAQRAMLGVLVDQQLEGFAARPASRKSAAHQKPRAAEKPTARERRSR